MFVPPLKPTENHDGVRLQQPSNLLISDGMKLCDRRSLGRWWITFTWVKKTPVWLVTVVAINQLWLGIMMGCNPVVRGYKGIIIYTGWWYNNHLEKYEFVNGKIIIPYIYMKWKIKIMFETTNRQLNSSLFSLFISDLSAVMTACFCFLSHLLLLEIRFYRFISCFRSNSFCLKRQNTWTWLIYIPLHVYIYKYNIPFNPIKSSLSHIFPH